MTVYTGTGARTTALIGGTSGVQTQGTVGVNGGRMRLVEDTYELLAAEATSTIWLARLPSNACILNLSRLSWDDASSDATTFDVGTFNPTGFSGLTDDDNSINDGLDAGTATAGKALIANIVNAAGKYLWQLAGAAADPKQPIDIKITAQDATSTDTATVTWSIVYTID